MCMCVCVSVCTCVFTTHDNNLMWKTSAPTSHGQSLYTLSVTGVRTKFLVLEGGEGSMLSSDSVGVHTEFLVWKGKGEGDQCYLLRVWEVGWGFMLSDIT